MQYDLLTFGSAVVDKILCVDEAFLENMAINKGSTRAHLNLEHDSIIGASPSKNILSIPGGSAANATKVVAGLGLKCAYIAKIGKDKWGEFYRNSFLERNIHPYFSECKKLPTGSLLCLITPDGERTMCPDLRACQSISKADIKPKYFDDVRLFHMDGYNFYYEEAFYTAVEIAHQKNCPISIDFSSYELIRTHFDYIHELLRQQKFNLIFANEREAFELTGKSDAVDACHALAQFCPNVTIMMGEKGSVSIADEKLIVKHTKAIKPLDTTGAGDMYVGAYLYGYLSGYSPEECMALGTATAAEGIQVFGGELPLKYLQQLKERLPNLELTSY